ncbi:PIG-L deacetylase family protein [Azospirillum canadense]|uniref:PIG-L deacetylase family protein n=1 Tax=Azospirillum canadense TaxID=403962 RepID=UPI00222656EA|nr:PIG-L family deacetylase [Azospirillum canadense]MCW2237339.1 LmbE family N-acetylglucosaminyl deacetylase [Azospirillum canadense]
MPFPCIDACIDGALPASRQQLPFDHSQRALVVVAHPDDETIGAGAQLGRINRIRILHTTDGAPRTGPDAEAAGCTTAAAYAALRRTELERALALAGVAPDRLDGLGFADQGASYHLAALTRLVMHRIEDERPDVVLTHAYEGGHPDHDATAFAVHAACTLLDGVAPRIVEMAGYHGAGGEGGTVFQDFLPRPGIPACTVWLDPEDRVLKRRMLDAHASQARTLAPFRDDVERFRPAPAYDFTRPPHDGPLNYDRFSWGITGERWRALAAEALRTLGLAASGGEGGGCP